MAAKQQVLELWMASGAQLLHHQRLNRRLLTTDNATCGKSASRAIGSRLGSSLHTHQPAFNHDK